MGRYDRNFDYGLRGYDDTAPSRYYRARAPERRYGPDYDERRDPRGRLSNRVTARYNEDYVFGGRGDRFPINHNMYTGDRETRIGDARFYRYPYLTRGGTRTWRGMPMGFAYDRDFSGYDTRYDEP